VPSKKVSALRTAEEWERAADALGYPPRVSR
jgi:hypothetical protein